MITTIHPDTSTIRRLFSCQAFAIAPKIKEVNEYLADNRNSPVVVREVCEKSAIARIPAPTALTAAAELSQSFLKYFHKHRQHTNSGSQHYAKAHGKLVAKPVL